jgi:hypothetical protein
MRRSDSDITFQNVMSFTIVSFGRMARQKTISGLWDEIKAFMRYILMLEKKSPYTIQIEEYSVADVKSMDAAGFPRMVSAQRGLVEEMLIRADRAGGSLYSGNPKGKPYPVRVDAASQFMWVAMRATRSNAMKGMKPPYKIR